jgi:hypothetical protein
LRFAKHDNSGAAANPPFAAPLDEQALADAGERPRVEIAAAVSRGLRTAR